MPGLECAYSYADSNCYTDGLTCPYGDPDANHSPADSAAQFNTDGDPDTDYHAYSCANTHTVPDATVNHRVRIRQLAIA
jgi:hypothetical protein